MRDEGLAFLRRVYEVMKERGQTEACVGENEDGTNYILFDYTFEDFLTSNIGQACAEAYERSLTQS